MRHKDTAMALTLVACHDALNQPRPSPLCLTLIASPPVLPTRPSNLRNPRGTWPLTRPAHTDISAWTELGG